MNITVYGHKTCLNSFIILLDPPSQTIPRVKIRNVDLPEAIDEYHSSVQNLHSSGFPLKQCIAAVKWANGDIDKALDLIMSSYHEEETDCTIIEEQFWNGSTIDSEDNDILMG